MESWILSAEAVSPAPVCRTAAPDFDGHTCAHTHARTQIHLRLQETRAAGRPSLAGVDNLDFTSDIQQRWWFFWDCGSVWIVFCTATTTRRDEMRKSASWWLRRCLVVFACLCLPACLPVCRPDLLEKTVLMLGRALKH